MSRKTKPDLKLLAHALQQVGPWAAQEITVTPDWVCEKMQDTIHRIDWNKARADVQRFLPLGEQEGLRLWGADFFLHYLTRMN